MTGTTISPNMGLVIPTVAVDPGPDWANNVNASLSILDQHNHSAGSGVPITPAGININADLPFNINNATMLRSARFSAQGSLLSGALDLGCTYVSGVDLYYNDLNGNHIQLTSGGTVNATSSGISSGSATASFVSSVLVVNSASSTPANIQAGSILIGNNVSGSKFATLSAPSALASNYSLVLPTIPAATSIVTVDTSGNIAAQTTVDNSTVQISTNVIGVKANGIAQSNLYVRTTGVSVSAGNVAISLDSGIFSTTSASFVSVTNLSVTIVTTGRPVVISLISYPQGYTSGEAYITASTGTQGSLFQFLRDGSASLGIHQLSSNASINTPVFSVVDVPLSGSHTYVFQAESVGGGSPTATIVSHMGIMAYEI